MISTALIWRQCNGVLWWPTQEMVWWALKLFEKNSTDISIQNSVIYFFSDICFHSLYFCFESDAFFRWILCQGGGVGSLWQWWRLERQRLKALRICQKKPSKLWECTHTEISCFTRERLLFEQAGLLLYGGFDNTLAALGDCWRIDLASQPPTWIRSQNMGDANTACWLKLTWD